jgi:hypothetical protein
MVKYEDHFIDEFMQIGQDLKDDFKEVENRDCADSASWNRSSRAASTRARTDIAGYIAIPTIHS